MPTDPVGRDGDEAAKENLSNELAAPEADASAREAARNGFTSDDSDSREHEDDGDTSLAPLLGRQDDGEATVARAPTTATPVIHMSAKEVMRAHASTLACFATTLVVTTMSMSVPFPFLAQEFANAGLSPGLVGVVFASLPFGVLLVSPHVPKLMWRFGVRKTAQWSLVGQACAVFGTTLAGRANWKMWLAGRLTQGFFNAITSVTMLCVVTRAVPEAVSLASGIQEVAAGFGTLVGPIFGGVLFDVSRHPALPLACNGMAILMAIPFVMRVLKSIEADNRSVSRVGEEESSIRPSFLRVLRHPTFLASALAELVVSTSFGGIPTTLPLFLHQTFSFSPSMIGVVYSLLAGLYALATPLIGMISHDSKLGDILLCLIGMSSMALAHLLFGPSALLDLPNLSDGARKRLCVWTASVIYGVGSAFAFVPLLPLQQASVKGEGARYQDVVNGMFLSFYFFGEMLGQLCGSSLVHAMGYPAASTCWSGAIIASASGLVLVQFGASMMKKYKRFKASVATTLDRVRSTDSFSDML